MMDNNTDRYRKKLLETFRAFDSLCKKHSIRYFAAFGSLIGAVRHNGIIPWDDDVDVWMLPEDYERFCSLRGKVEGHYDIMTEEDKDYWLHLLVKFVDTDTTLWEAEEYPCITGVFIDIYALYECGQENALKRKKEFDKYVAFFRRSMRHYSLRNIISPLYHARVRVFYEVMKDVLLFKPMHTFYKRKYGSFLDMIKHESGDRYVCFAGDCGEREIFKKEYLDKVVKLSFEGMEIDAPAYYDLILTQIYGDYMELPPEEKRKSDHPHVFLDLDRRWEIKEIRKYKKSHKN